MKKVIACFAVLIIIILLAGGEFHSGLRIGYVGNSGSNHWRAKYKKLDGRMSRIMRTDDDMLNITTETQSGSITIKVYDADKNLIYEADGAGEYKVSTDGRIKVVIEADDHKGSFDIRIAES